MPKVWNIRDPHRPKMESEGGTAIYIGRPSKWGNPFSHMPNTLATHRTTTRKEAIERYSTWLSKTTHTNTIKELRGKDLVCFCAPLPCHGDILLKLANPE